jgi:hypothetical protein
MKMTSEVYLKCYTSSDNSTFEFVSLKDFMESHQDSYQDGISDVLYKKVDDGYEFLD